MPHFAKIFPLICLWLLCCQELSFAQVDLISALNKKIIPISTLEPDDSFDDLIPLIEILNGKEIVALGEATHGTKEFPLYKDRLVRYLVTNLGFRCIIMEGDFTGTETLNEYVSSGHGNIEDAIEKMAIGVWSTKEFIDMVEWIKQYNFNKSDSLKVKFYGCDMQYAFSSGEYLKTNKIKLSKALSQEALKGLDIVMDWKTISLTKAKLIAVNILVSELTSSLVIADTQQIKTFNEQVIKSLIQRIDYLKAAYLFDKDEIRDRSMAENVEWILKNVHVKSIIWAHNLHIAKETTKENNLPMGAYLAKKHASQYYSLGFGFNSGTINAFNKTQGKIGVFPIPDVSIKNSSDYIFKQLNIPNFILDFHTGSSDPLIAKFLDQKINSRAIGASYDEKRQAEGGDGTFQKLNLLYDGLVFFNRTSAITYIKH